MFKIISTSSFGAQTETSSATLTYDTETCFVVPHGRFLLCQYAHCTDLDIGPSRHWSWVVAKAFSQDFNLGIKTIKCITSPGILVWNMLVLVLILWSWFWSCYWFDALLIALILSKWSCSIHLYICIHWCNITKDFASYQKQQDNTEAQPWQPVLWGTVYIEADPPILINSKSDTLSQEFGGLSPILERYSTSQQQLYMNVCLAIVDSLRPHIVRFGDRTLCNLVFVKCKKHLMWMKWLTILHLSSIFLFTTGSFDCNNFQLLSS